MSKRIDELTASKKAKIQEISEALDKRYAEKRTATEDELKAVDALEVEVSGIEAMIGQETKAEARIEAEKRAVAPERRPDSAPDDGKKKAAAEERSLAPIIDMEPKDVRDYSLMRALKARAERDWTGADLERRCHEELLKKTGRGSRGILVPIQALYRTPARQRMDFFEMRAAIGKVLPDPPRGAATVATDLLADSFIEILRARSVAVALGATVLDGLVGDIDIPRQSVSQAATWIAENADSDDLPLDTDVVSGAPFTLAMRQDITRKMMKQGTPAMEDLVRNDIRNGIGLGVDIAVFQGVGTTEPLGILNQVGIGTATGGPTWANAVGAEEDLAAANALMGSLAYVMNPGDMSTAKTTPKVAGAGATGFVWDQGEVNGYPAVVSNHLPAPGVGAGSTLFGNFSDVLLFLWDGLDLFSDPYTIGDSGGIRVRGFQEADTNVRHVESFSEITAS